jgi:hypothetical protein
MELEKPNFIEQFDRVGLRYRPGVFPRVAPCFDHILARWRSAARSRIERQFKNLMAEKGQTFGVQELSGFFGIESPTAHANLWFEYPASCFGFILIQDPTDVGPRNTFLFWNGYASADDPLDVEWWAEILVADGRPVPHTFKHSMNPDHWLRSQDYHLTELGGALTQISKGYMRTDDHRSILSADWCC